MADERRLEQLEVEMDATYNVWIRWRNTVDEAVLRNMNANRVNVLTNRMNQAWSNYSTALLAWYNEATS